MLNRKRRLLAIAVCVIVGCAGAAAWFSSSLLSNYVLRDKVEKIAADRFHVDVKLSSLHIAVFPSLHVDFTNLVLRDPNRNDLPPLLEIKKCSVDASLLSLFERRPHLRSLHMEGLIINVPPRDHSGGSGSRVSKKRFRTDFLIDEVTSDDMLLNILRRGSAQYLSFAFQQLRIDSFRPDEGATFHAILTNPKPLGQIKTYGQFGPWNPDDPSQSPVSGKYEFSDADLATIRGISGTLSSSGSFTGVLDYIQVRGTTSTPNFELSASKHPVPLDTQFSAVVDGMNGNTILNAIKIRLVDSNLQANGEVAKGPRQPGRAVTLKVVARSARVQDLLRVALKSNTPLLTGLVSLQTQFVIPSRRSEDTDITKRIRLNGQFQIVSALFNEPEVQQKVDALSRRGRGRPKADDGTAVSQLAGTFTLNDGVIRFSKLAFRVSGAAIRLDGTYDLQTEVLDFKGTLSLEAKLSQTTTGVKSLFLKLVDPLFEKKNAGAVLPIKITGTREHPSFGVDMGRVFARK